MEPPGKEGVTNLMSMVWTKASEKRNSEQMAGDIDSLGLAVGGLRRHGHDRHGGLLP